MTTFKLFNMTSFPFLRYNSPANGSRRIHQCLKLLRTKQLFPKSKSKPRLLFISVPVIVPVSCVGLALFRSTHAVCEVVHSTQSQSDFYEQFSSVSEDQNIFLRVLVTLLSTTHDFLASSFQNLRLVMRFFRICMTFGPLFSVYPFTLYFPSMQQGWCSLLLAFIQFSGPTFVKLGQWASTRRDLFSPEFCNILGTLHRDGTIHSWRHTKESLMNAFGDEWQTWCRIDSDYPVYSGCIGQVYKGYLKYGLCKELRITDVACRRDEDLCVAIKVLHPGVAELVNMDLGVMHAIAVMVSHFPGAKWLSLPDIVEEFEKLMKRQIDFRIEARNLDVFNKNFSKVSNIRFPVPIWPYVKADVLIETFEEGIPMSYYTTQSTTENTAVHAAESKIKKVLARMGVDALLKMVFTDNFVHADLHPGNILVQKQDFDDETQKQISEKNLKEHLQLVFLDAGIIASLAPSDFQNFRNVFTALVMNKGHEVADLFLKHSRIHHCKNVEEFRDRMAKLVNDAHQQTMRMGLLQVGQLFNDLFTLLMTHQVLLESNMASIIWGIMVLEGLGRSLDPQIDLLKAARPILISKLLGS